MTYLPKEQAYIVKEIHVVGKTRHGVDTMGYIIYERYFSENYIMNENPEQGQFERLMAGPDDGRFPVDELDNILLDAIKSQFPDSFTKSHMIIAGLGANQYDYKLEQPKQIATIIVEPDFTGIDINLLVGRSFARFIKEVNIYQNYSSEGITGLFLNAKCNPDRHEDIIDKLYQVNFL